MQEVQWFDPVLKKVGLYIHDGEGNEMGAIPFKYDEVEIMQYTGLKDKNGKEIYEGDIIGNNLSKGVVKYGEHNCGCCDGVYGFWTEGGADLRYPEGYEIVGNIYENPELLK